MSQTQTTVVTSNRFIRRKEAAKKLGIGISTLDRWQATDASESRRILAPAHLAGLSRISTP